MIIVLDLNRAEECILLLVTIKKLHEFNEDICHFCNRNRTMDTKKSLVSERLFIVSEVNLLDKEFAREQVFTVVNAIHINT